MSVSTLSNAYYQLPTSTSGTGTNAASTAALPSSVSVAQLLLQAENPSQSGNGLDSISLSPQAQSYLDSYNSSSASSSFLLSGSQQQQITQILEKYKDAPQTQDTFNQIQNDLKAAGLSPDQLIGKDLSQSFNPEMDLLDGLNGISAAAAPSIASEQTKATNFINQIYSQWQAISTQSAAAATTTPS